MEWITDGEASGVIAFTRHADDRRAFVAANLTKKTVEFVPSKVTFDKKRKPILSEGFSLNGESVKLDPYGYVVVEL